MKTKEERFCSLKSSQISQTKLRLKYSIKLYKAFAILLLTALIGSFLAAEEADSSLLTLERIFSFKEFSPERFESARWLKDGSGYTTLERSKSNAEARDIVLYDPETGKREILVPSKRLIPKLEKPTLPAVLES